MEELRTTEVLDREILEDARKKAFKILKNADDTITANKRDWEKKTSEAVDSIRIKYAEKTEKANEEIFARLPLDKRRLRSEISDGLLVKAMGDFLRSLKRETLLSILKNEVSRRLDEGIEDEAIHNVLIRYSGMSLSEAKQIFESAFPKNTSRGKSKKDDEENTFSGIDKNDDTLIHEFPYMEISAKTFRLTVSVEDVAETLMKEKRAELAVALLGEGVLND